MTTYTIAITFKDGSIVQTEKVGKITTTNSCIIYESYIGGITTSYDRNGNVSKQTGPTDKDRKLILPLENIYMICATEDI